MDRITLELPWPPSQNSIWRAKRGRTKPYRSPEYVAWIKEAGQQWMIQRRGQPSGISGKFQATITIYPPDNKRLFDIDNRTKVILDAVQGLGLIENDHLCRRLLVEYPEKYRATPSACLILEPWVS